MIVHQNPGLAVYLLYRDVPLYWVIKSGKQKDQADFTATGFQVSHSLTQRSRLTMP